MKQCYYTIKLLLTNGQYLENDLKAMTHKEALTMRSKQTNPALWGIVEVKNPKPEEILS